MSIKMKAYGTDGKWWFSDENLHFRTREEFQFKTVDIKNAPFAFENLRLLLKFPDKNGNEIYENDVVAFYGKAETEEMKELERNHERIVRTYDFSNVKDLAAYDKEWNKFNEEYAKLEQDAPIVELDRALVSTEMLGAWLKGEPFGYEGERLYNPCDCVVVGNIDENPVLIKV